MRESVMAEVSELVVNLTKTLCQLLLPTTLDIFVSLAIRLVL